MRINTNMAALNAWRSMETNQNNLQKSLGRLSSGYRINTAADDAAGLAVSEKMTAQSRGVAMATRNAQDATSLMQTAEGGAGNIQDMLQRMRELAVQAGSDTLRDPDRAQLQQEFTALQSEIDRTAGSVTFNGRTLLDGSSGDQISVTAGNGGATGVTASNLSTSIISGDLVFTNVTGATAETNDTGDAAGSLISTPAATINSATGFNGALTGKTMTLKQGTTTLTVNFDATDTSTGSAVSSLTASQFMSYVNAKANSLGMTVYLTDADTAAKTHFTVNSGAVGSAANVTVGGNAFTMVGALNGDDAVMTNLKYNGNALTLNTDYTMVGNTFVGKGDYTGIGFTAVDSKQATISLTRNNLTFQVGANTSDTISASIGNLTTSNLGVATGTASIDTKSHATSAITLLDTALNTVSTERAKMGAMQNRLDNAVSSLQTQNENIVAANSRIRDVDMAAEMAQFTKFQVLSQASTAMLAQANQLSQGILSLLR